MAEIIVAEFDATARSSIRRFQTFVVGNTEHPGAPGSVGPGGIRRRKVSRRSMGFGVPDGRGVGGTYAPTDVVPTRDSTTSSPSTIPSAWFFTDASLGRDSLTETHSLVLP